MNTKELFLAPECLGVQIELVDVTADYYGDSRERQAQPVGYRYSVLLREHASDKIVVKIAGPQQMEAPVSCIFRPDGAAKPQCVVHGDR